jgi:cell division protein FtsQ
MKKQLIIGIALLVLLTSYKSQNFFFDLKFNIEEIVLENNFILKEDVIKKDLVYLYDKNLFFLNVNDIKKLLLKHNFIQSFEIKKIYPNRLKIKIFEKKPVAILQQKKDKFYFTKNGDLINYIDLEEYKNLPIVLGGKKKFKFFYNELKKINFPINLVKQFYFFETGRWDLLTYKNQIIKLPIENYISSLENFISIESKDNFDKYQIFDYRIKDQLILK